MSQVWIWVHANPGLATFIVIVVIGSTYNLLATISNHILLGWKALLANFAQQPMIINQVEPEVEEEEVEEEEPPSVDVARTTQSTMYTDKPPTRFDRINNS